MTPKYEVQTYTLCDGYVNTWSFLDEATGSWKPETFPNRKAAQRALDEHLADIQAEIECGQREPDEGYSPEDFRIMRVSDN